MVDVSLKNLILKKFNPFIYAKFENKLIFSIGAVNVKYTSLKLWL